MRDGHHDLRRACTSVLNVPGPHDEIRGKRPPIPGGCRGQCGTPVPRGPVEPDGRAPSGSRRRRPSNAPPPCACRGGTASLCRRSWALCPIPCTCLAPRSCCRPRPAPSERPRSARIGRRSAGGGRIGENAVARLAGVWWREWPIRVGGNGCFYSGASNGVRTARDRVALMARGDERSLLSRIAPPPPVVETPPQGWAARARWKRLRDLGKRRRFCGIRPRAGIIPPESELPLDPGRGSP